MASVLISTLLFLFSGLHLTVRRLMLDVARTREYVCCADSSAALTSASGNTTRCGNLGAVCEMVWGGDGVAGVWIVELDLCGGERVDGFSMHEMTSRFYRRCGRMCSWRACLRVGRCINMKKTVF